MHSGASVAQPCLACGAGRETRTPTPKRWYLKPMRLPIPPYPHVGRRYVTMFRKGQARLIAAFRFLRTFLIPRASGRRRPRSPLIRHPRRGTGRNSRTGAILGGNGKPRRIRLPSPSQSTWPGASHAGGENRQYLCGYIDIIYSARRSPVTALPAPAPDQQLMGFRTLPYTVIPHAFALPKTQATTKSTQIGHKLCMNRRNRPVSSACIAMRA